MLVLSTQATVFETSCYLLAARAGEGCLVLDPGAGSAGEVLRMTQRHDLTPVAVAATHGHPDHLWEAARLADRWDVPFLLGAPDLDRLDDPAGILGPGLSEAFAALAGSPWRRPARVEALPAERLSLPGLGIEVELLPAPGHTPGSTLYLVSASPSAESVLPPAAGPLPPGRLVVLTGDVLFAGSIGRVDLPGGDGPTMLRTLRDLRERIPPDAWLLPGHGPVTTMSRELTSNPYLDDRWLASGVL